MKSASLSIAARLKKLKKPGDQFNVKTHGERQAVVNEIQNLRRYGLLTVQIITREDEEKGGWKVVAI